MSKISGIFYAILSAVAFGFMPIFVKLAYDGGANTVTVAFLRFLFSSIILFSYFLIKKIDYKLPKKEFKRVAILGFTGYAATSVTLYLSYKYISVGLATIMHFVYPIIVTMLACLIYKEKLTLLKTLALTFSVIGVYVLVGFSSIKLSTLGVILAIGSGITYSIYIFDVGYSCLKNVDSLILTFYLCLFSTLGILVYGLGVGELNFNFEASGYISIVGLTVICTIAAIILFNLAVKIIGSSNTSVLSTLEPITGIALSAIIFKEVISFNTIIGSALIIISVYLVLKEMSDKPSEEKEIIKTSNPC